LPSASKSIGKTHSTPHGWYAILALNTRMARLKVDLKRSKPLYCFHIFILKIKQASLSTTKSA
jgi:hypothetical protein